MNRSDELKKIVFLYLVVFSLPAIAFQSACKEDILPFCSKESGINDPEVILNCLKKNVSKLSMTCKQEIQRAAKIVKQTTPPGGGSLGLLGGMTGIAPLTPMLMIDGRVLPSEAKEHDSSAVTENNLKISLPLKLKGPHTSSISLNSGVLNLGEKQTLNNGKRINRDLYRSEIGIQYGLALENKRSFGLQGSFGYTGDAFTSETQSYSVSANYSYPGKESGHWVLMLMASSVSPFGPIPIPGFFYVHRTQNFTGVFGFPILSMQWTPIAPWSFSFSALGPIIRAEAAYGTLDSYQIYSAFVWTQQRYMLNEREKDKERLTMEEKKLEIGLRHQLSKSVFVDLQSGLSFDRSLYIGEDVYDDKGGKALFDNSLYVGWNLRFLF